MRTTLIVGALGLCVGCQGSSAGTQALGFRGSHGPAMLAVVEPHSTRHSVVYWNVLLTSRAAPVRAEAAKHLGEHLADDEATVWALSVATNDEAPIVKQAARKALVRMFDARNQARPRERNGLQEFGIEAREKAYQLGQGAVDVIEWLWENVGIDWSGFDGAALRA